MIKSTITQVAYDWITHATANTLSRLAKVSRADTAEVDNVYSDMAHRAFQQWMDTVGSAALPIDRAALEGIIATMPGRKKR
jgi:hypothetical protein